jgi:thioredoxin 2
MPTLQTLCPSCRTINRLDTDRVGDNPKCGRCHQLLLDNAPVAADDSGFERYLTREQLPLVVDFWADWCGPCKMMAPVFAQAAEQWRGKFRFLKVDTEQARQTASRFQIRSIPTLMIFRDGKVVASQAGAMPLNQLNLWISSNGG